VTGNEDLKRDGQREQARPKLPEARDRVKDAAAAFGPLNKLDSTLKRRARLLGG